MAANYSNDALPKCNYFRYRGGPDNSAQFQFDESVPNFTLGSSKVRIERLSEGSHTTLRELSADTQLEGTSRHPLEKPKFLFGDEVTVLDEALYVHEHK